MTRRRVVSNVAWLVADRAIRLVLAFVVGVIIARRLGPGIYGAFSYAQATVSVLAFFGLAAVEAIVVRMLVDEPERRDEILGSALLIRVLGGGATVVAAIGATRVLGLDGDLALVVPLVAGVTLFQASDVVEYWFRRTLASRASVLARAGALVVGASLRILATTASHPLLALAAAALAEAALVAIVLMVTLRRVDPAAAKFTASGRRMAAIIRQAAPMLLSAVAVAVYVRFGFVVLGNVEGTAAVGQIGVASIVAEATHALPAAVAASYGPILLAQRKLQPAAFDEGFRRMLRWFVAIGILIALATCLAAPTVMPMLFGQAYVQSGRVLSILVWSIVFVYMSIASELWFVGQSQQRYLLPKTAVAAACFVVLSLVLIPRYGTVGAAITTVLTYSVSAFWSNLFFSATRPLFRWQLRALCLMGPGTAPTPAPVQEP